VLQGRSHVTEACRESPPAKERRDLAMPGGSRGPMTDRIDESVATLRLLQRA
jgi:hypothetical protein